MYRPPAFREDRRDILHDAIRAHPLGTLVTCGSPGLVANVVPFTLDSVGDVLRAHLARANEQVAQLRDGSPTLVIFQGPQAYISPSWYATKREHGKVVPTWNYVIVQVRGTPMVIEDRDWLRNQIDELTSIHECGRAEPWSPDDAPADFIAGQMKGIVGLEIPIERIEGKWKASQNQPEPNRIGVERGLRADGRVDMADEVAARGKGS
ncbi:FMN-binding negative transcriptional regulator [Sphingomonas prati]|uniref:Transcriptional regulator n=1 Tax=Sphingomonas prati TaxID=1843237 RepID=A0A7W9BQU0_9SPHN|nr:FMN-binding negative transcriptional regulator [Sphingomonas prati]MBB5727928.1 transcriptional regulator [Sphingomonas prati]GGE81928.1 transcriptional regulator [Sphingomonas prati]